MKRLELWNWGHLEASHNQAVKQECSMTPEEFSVEYGVPNAFIVSYAGNITPPFDALAERLSCLQEIKWSILGDAGTPLPEAELAYTEEIIELAKKYPNVTGGMIDDFYSPKRLERFTPTVLQKMQKKLSENGLDFWAVLYEVHIAEENLKEYYDCFDGITYWIWKQEHIDDLDNYLEQFFMRFSDKRKMLGIYIWDYARLVPMEQERFKKQLEKYVTLLEENKVEGLIICSGCAGDANLETNYFLKDYLKSKFNNIP